MVRFLRVCAALVALAALLPVMADTPSSAPIEKRIVGYFPEWSVYQRKYNVADIPADKLTHINYAFAKITNGECSLFDSYAAIDKFYPGDKWDANFVRGNFRQLQLL